MTEVLFSSENQQYAVAYRRVVSVVIYVILNEASYNQFVIFCFHLQGNQWRRGSDRPQGDQSRPHRK